MRKQTLVSSLTTRFILENWHSCGCQYSQDVRVQVPLQQCLHGCRRMAPWLLLPRILLFLDTLRPRDIDGSESVAAFGVGVCARSLLSCRKLHWFRFFSFHWSQIPFPPSTPLNPFLDHCSCFNYCVWRQSFVIGASDPILLFTMVFNF